MNRYFDLTKEQKLALTNEQFNDALRVEAIHRGISAPIPISEELSRSEYRGYNRPGDAFKVYRICTADGYGGGGTDETKVGYLTEERAMAALEGIVSIGSDGYGATARMKLNQGSPSVQAVWITNFTPHSKAIKFSAFDGRETEEFSKLEEECAVDLSNVRQEAYDARVRVEKRAEYLRLAGGDEQIARAFWTKVESGPFPELQPVTA